MTTTLAPPPPHTTPPPSRTTPPRGPPRPRPPPRPDRQRGPSPLLAYVRQLWARRDFIAAFATARLTAQYSQARLGQLWRVATPLLNAAVYYLIFGVFMNAEHDVPDYVPFLITGVFVWTFTANTLMAGTRAISGNLGLVRALHFPRASLPLSLALQQLQQLLLSLAALVAILLCCGEFPGGAGCSPSRRSPSRPCSTRAWRSSWPGSRPAPRTSAS